jgi:hypothetical protein
MKSKTFAGQDEREIENEILKWRATNPHVAVKKIHAFKRVDAICTPSFRFIRRIPRAAMTRTIDYQD